MEELDFIYKMGKNHVLSLSNDVWHWSSFVDNEGHVWMQDFEEGFKADSLIVKNYICSVSAICAF